MQLTLARPDDLHLHLRDGAEMHSVLAHSARQFARAIVMPNLKPPVTTTLQALAYRDRILAALPAGASFEPLMTLYLTDHTSPDEVERAHASGHVHAVKLYPAGATTHSDAGVTDIARIESVIEALETLGMPLLVHGEVTDPTVDIFDRERVYIERILVPLVQRHPRLKLVLEHVTTEDGVRFVEDAPDTVAATVTAHHLLMNRNALFEGGLRPHHYCLPVLKAEHHRKALLAAATSGSPKFFLGTDSAPHAQGAKESACGCAGMYTAHAALELYAEAFETAGALDQLEAFASHNGADFYGLPRNTGTVTLVREDWAAPALYPFGPASVVPLRAGLPLKWRFSVD